MMLLQIMLWSMTAAVAIPMAVFIVESWLAITWRRRSVAGVLDERPGRDRVRVLVPAHDEQQGIAATIRALRDQVAEAGQIVVIADNCSDATAAIARSEGATVLERTDAQRRGKGFALDAGVALLAEAGQAPAIVVVMDADAVFVHRDGLAQLVRGVEATAAPAQAVYVLDPPVDGSVRTAVSCLAFLFKNWVRPAGLSRLSLPCHITGTGFAVPWALLREATLASGNIVEDMKLGVDMALAGRPVGLCLDVHMSSAMARGEAANRLQRTRWEHGHLQTLIAEAPRLLRAGLRRRDIRLLALAADLAVPPMSLLLLAWLVLWLLGATAAVAGLSIWPLAASSLIGVMFLCTVAAGWWRFARGRVPGRALLAVPFYVAAKLPIYVLFVLRPQRAWERTPRGGGS